MEGSHKHPNFHLEMLVDAPVGFALQVVGPLARKILQLALIIYGLKASIRLASSIFYRKVKSKKSKMKVSNARHFDLYYKDEYTDRIVDRLENFYTRAQSISA